MTLQPSLGGLSTTSVNCLSSSLPSNPREGVPQVWHLGGCLRILRSTIAYVRRKFARSLLWLRRERRKKWDKWPRVTPKLKATSRNVQVWSYKHKRAQPSVSVPRVKLAAPSFSTCLTQNCWSLRLQERWPSFKTSKAKVRVKSKTKRICEYITCSMTGRFIDYYCYDIPLLKIKWMCKSSLNSYHCLIIFFKWLSSLLTFPFYCIID